MEIYMYMYILFLLFKTQTFKNYAQNNPLNTNNIEFEHLNIYV